MWAFFSRRFRTYLLFALAAPVVALGLDGLGRRLEERSGPNTLTRLLCSGGDWLRRHGRGPLAARLRRDEAARAGGDVNPT